MGTWILGNGEKRLENSGGEIGEWEIGEMGTPSKFHEFPI